MHFKAKIEIQSFQIGVFALSAHFWFRRTQQVEEKL